MGGKRVNADMCFVAAALLGVFQTNSNNICQTNLRILMYSNH